MAIGGLLNTDGLEWTNRYLWELTMVIMLISCRKAIHSTLSKKKQVCHWVKEALGLWIDCTLLQNHLLSCSLFHSKGPSILGLKSRTCKRVNVKWSTCYCNNFASILQIQWLDLCIAGLALNFGAVDLWCMYYWNIVVR